MTVETSDWYGVRCVFDHGTTDGEHAYEERVTLWRAVSIDQALVLAEAEAAGYAETLGGSVTYTGLAQGYALPDPPGHGGEVFSLVRLDRRDRDAYLDAVFDTGGELQQPRG